jgi:arsenate reductase (thioredoxin)
MEKQKRKVLFLCTGNTVRSQIAEAIVNTNMGEDWEAYSAGVKPGAAVSLKALQVLNEIGISHHGHPKSPDEFRGVDFDLVVTLCDDADQNCPVWLGKGKRVHEGFPDPGEVVGSPQEVLAAFRALRDDIGVKIPALLRRQTSTGG